MDIPQIDDEGDITTKMETRNGKIIVVRSQDVAPYLKQNAEERAAASSWRPYSTGKNQLRKVADIPNVVVEQWLKEGVNVFSDDPDMQRKVRRKLDDMTNQKLRTMPGKLGVRTRHF
jgi:hypothetical protein